MKSYEEIDFEQNQPTLKEFLIDVAGMIGCSVLFALFMIFGIPWLAGLVIR